MVYPPEEAEGRRFLAAHLRAERRYGRTPGRSLFGGDEAAWLKTLKGRSLAWIAARCDLEDWCRREGPLASARHWVKVRPGDGAVTVLRDPRHARRCEARVILRRPA